MTTKPVNQLPPVDVSLLAGIDIGGTKVDITDTASATTHRYKTSDYADVDALLREYFQKLGRRPRYISIAMAGPRDDETGAVKLANVDWPVFAPLEANSNYPGTTFETTNDLTAAIAGIISETETNLTELKPGVPMARGTKLVVTLSTGINVAAAVWDSLTKRYVFVACEAGHIGFQPKNNDELAYLDHLQQRSEAEHKHVSVELALSGKYGIESLVDHLLERHSAHLLARVIERAREANRPIGAVLREVAERNSGDDRVVARTILYHLGNMIGSALRDYTMLFKATGGVYLTGSVSLGLADYFVQETDFIKRFIHPGAMHSQWIEKIPISLVTDPYVTAKGALALAQQSAL